MNNVIEVLEKLNIKYEIVEHKAVYTKEEAQFIKNKITGIGCKNLFLKNKLNYYLYIIEDNKKADLKNISKKLNIGRLSFASEKELNEKLKLTRGSVTPLGIINDKKTVILLIDKDLKEQKILVHPNINTSTVNINYNDLIKYIEYFGNDYYEV